MNDYLLLLRKEPEQLDVPPEEMGEHLRLFTIWVEGLIQNGHHKAGRPLEGAGAVIRGGESPAILDGPYAESKEAVAGYFILQGESLEQVVELAKGCPIVHMGGSIEVRPFRNVEMPWESAAAPNSESESSAAEESASVEFGVNDLSDQTGPVPAATVESDTDKTGAQAPKNSSVAHSKKKKNEKSQKTAKKKKKSAAKSKKGAKKTKKKKKS